MPTGIQPRGFSFTPRALSSGSMIGAIPGKHTNTGFDSGYIYKRLTTNSPGTRKMVACDHLHVHTTDRAGERLTSSVTFLNSR